MDTASLNSVKNKIKKADRESKPFFSIIMASYNSEKFIAAALDSIKAQKFKDFEVIIINDGSYDNSPAIIEKFCQQDRRFRLIDQDNCGAGHARNRGFEQAKGKYVIFLDADDFYSPEMLQKIFDKIKTTNADMLAFRSNAFDVNTREFSPTEWTIKRKLLPQKPVFNFRDVKENRLLIFNWWGWDKAYKIDLLRENKLWHQEILSTNDLFLNTAAYICADKISIINDILVHHTINISDSIVNKRKYYYENALFALIWLHDFIKNRGLYDILEHDFINYSSHFLLWQLDHLPYKEKNLLIDRYKYRYQSCFDFNEYKNDSKIIEKKEFNRLLEMIN